MMNLPWFRRIGLFFIPVKLPGWIILAASIAAAVFKFIAIDRKSHSASDTLINFFFWLILLNAFYSLIAWVSGRE
jgi:hypothetical protein